MIKLNSAAQELIAHCQAKDIQGCFPSLMVNLQTLVTRQVAEMGFEQEVVNHQGSQYFQVILKLLENSPSEPSPNQDSKDTPTVLAVFNDFTTCYKPVENALLASEQRFRDVVEASGEYIWEVDAKGILTFVSDKLFNVLGYEPVDAIGRNPLDFMPHSEAKRIRRIIARTGGKQVFRNLEHRIYSKSGQLVWQKIAGVPLLNSQQEIIGYRGTALNITTRKVAEANLIASAERNRLLASIALRIRGSLILDEILKIAVDEVRQFLRADRVVIYRFQPTDWSGYIAIESVADGWKSVLGSSVYDPCFSETYAKQYELGKIRAITDIYNAQLAACHIKLLENFQVKANLAVPIILNGQYAKSDTASGLLESSNQHLTLQPYRSTHGSNDLGKAEATGELANHSQLWGLLVAHQCSDTREWQQPDVDLLKQLATQVSIAIQQSELYHQLQVELSERKRAEEELMKLSRAVEQSPSMVIITNTNYKIEYINPKFTETTGYTSEEVIGQNPRFLNAEKIPDAVYDELWQTIVAGNEWRGEFFNKKKNGELYWESSSISAIKNVHGEITHFITVSEDITERKWSEATIRHLAYHDSLTDLPNRLLFKERLKTALSQAKRDRHLLALMFLDLDCFKNINDTLGHTVGDRLLKEVADRLSSCLRASDTVARMGGDEFMVLLPQIAHADDAAIVAEKICYALQPTFYLDEHELHVTASIGISVYPYDGEDSEVLWKNADVAMYRAKEHGRDNYQHYTAAMNAQALEDLALVNNLRRALEREELVLYYQPQVDVRTGRITAMEALLRWQHPKLGMISPSKFIPIAEEYGLIVKIGTWVLEAACHQNKLWQQANLPPVPVAVNFSASQFQQRNFVSVVKQILEITELSPHLLELEITESVVMKDQEGAIATLQKLHQMGINISIDDFGTGYSSLGHLKRFPIQKMKIDRTFVKDIKNTKQDAAITQVIITMAHSLNLKATAEGVETREQLETLKSMGCDEVQGYLFSPPLDVMQATELLAQQKLSLNNWRI